MPYTKKTDWRVIGVSGDTVDGRTISERELREIAEQYDPEVYGARINLEHMNFLFPDFAGGYGDVVELKAEPWAKDETKTALLAKLNITDSLQKLWDSGQKIYTSMEITPRFADTKKAYLTGLAITDTPASLGTTANYTAAKNKAEEKIFTAYRQTETQEITMTKPQDSNPVENQDKPLTEEHAESVFSRLFAKYFGKREPEQQETPPTNTEKLSEPKEGRQIKQDGWDGFSKVTQLLEKLDGEIEANRAETAAMRAETATLRAEFDAFKADIDTRPASGDRLDHTGTAEGIRW
ncbi:GPO family capsid scaffolding protein [Neisseria cinerea]|uniref:GPO family capsid scaffolding protein n=1 Tax=Neisseria cinerea TaxID=483 RepID=UPI000D35D14F|nr:GPO family capsid scaffolding protein [Neisseria cinerea]